MNPRFLVVALAGIVFGAGLAISGMTNPARVIGFLDVAGAWDPALVFVMAGAVATFGGGLAIVRKLGRGRGRWGVTLPTRDTNPIERRLIVGALIFGVGWGLAGFCPGPALANLAAGRIEALVFVPTMAIGMLVARAVFRADR